VYSLSSSSIEPCVSTGAVKLPSSSFLFTTFVIPHRVRRSVLAIGILAALGTSCALPSLRPETAASAARIEEVVDVLAADSLRGRDTPSPELNELSRFAAARLQRAGFQPFATLGGYLQRWDYNGVKLSNDAVLAATGCGQQEELKLGSDLAVMPAGRVVFQGRPVGSDLSLTRARDSLRGRVVVVASDSANPQSVAHRLMGLATSRGADALILVLPDAVLDSVLNRVADAVSRMNHQGELPVAIVSGSGWRRLTKVLESCATSVVDMRGNLQAANGPTFNVVGFLPGTDPAVKNQYVVLSAHLDHLGIGVPDLQGDSIYNGADDNASGVAAVLEVARLLARNPPRRSMIVLLPTGEEKGRLGSAFFVSHPPIDLKEIVADINLDGVGRAWGPDTVSAEGLQYSSLGQSVRNAAGRHPELRLTVVADQWPGLNYFGRSDQIEFAQKGIASIFFSSAGPHDDYHRPSDSADRLDAPFAARVAGLTYWTVLSVANAPSPPSWDEAARATFVR
jgi:peptidase M28-like protein